MDKKLVDLVHAVTLQQSEKGFGYPVIVSEAHNQAVVTSKDRWLFMEQLRENLVKSGFPVTQTNKRRSKNLRII